MSGLGLHALWARRAFEVIALRRANAGMPLLDGRFPGDAYVRDAEARTRLTRPTLKPQGAYAKSETEAVVARDTAYAQLNEKDNASALTRLADRLGFDSTAIGIMTLVWAIEVDLDARELASVATGRRRSPLTSEVIADALELPAAAIASALHPAAPLRASRAVVVDGDGPGAFVSLRPGLAVLLDGDRRLAPSLSRAVQEIAKGATAQPPVWLPAGAEAELAKGIAVLEPASGTRHHPVLLVRGPRGAGRSALATRIALGAGRVAMLCRSDRLRELEADAADATDRRAILADLLADAAFRDAVLVIADIDRLTEEGTLPPWRSVLLSDHRGPLILTSTGRTSGLHLERPLVELTLSRPSLGDRETAWTFSLGNVPEAARPPDTTTLAGELAARYVLGAGAIAEVVASATTHAEVSSTLVDQAELERALSRRLSLDLGAAGQVITRKARFSELVLPEDVVDTLHDVIAMVRERAQILERWGLQRHLGISRGVSALFSGEPGTGKTMAASVLASELGLELIRIDLAAVVSKYVGETEKNLARIFDQAQDAHAMLLFDEADSLFGKRTELRSAQDRFANLEVNYLLQRMEGFDGISVLTTNWESSIDQALLRRLNFRIRFPEPEVEERMELWRRLIPDEAKAEDDLDVALLAERFDMTGGYIKNAIVRAAVIAARGGRRLNQEDLLAGALNEYAEMGKVMPSTESPKRGGTL